MTYAKGSSITAADYNTFAGLTGSAAASAAAATQVAGYLYGVGYGDRGYGQSTPALTAKSTGNAVGQEWQNLRTVMANLASWQNTATTLLPPSSAFNSGANITAHQTSSPSFNAYGIADELALLDTNRLNYQTANMAVTSLGVTSTRASAWGSGNSSISAEFSFTFASEDAARYFFNTGGELRVALNHPSVASAQDQAWNTILNNLAFGFRANSSVRNSGSYGTAQAIGYYQLTTAYQTIVNGSSVFTTPYASNSFDVAARAVSITGSNGAKGSVIYIRVTLTDGHTNAFYDSVNSGTNGSISVYKANAGLTAIPAAPTGAVVTSF